MFQMKFRGMGLGLEIDCRNGGLRQFLDEFPLRTWPVIQSLKSDYKLFEHDFILFKHHFCPGYFVGAHNYFMPVSFDSNTFISCICCI